MPNYEIVGSHFRPPAKALLLGISQGTKLHLRAEPSNPFDINAIQVLLLSKDIIPEDHITLNQELSGFGKEISDILSQDEWHLGYIRKEIAKVLRDSQIIIPETLYEVEFSINFSGKPTISLSEF